MSCCSCLCCGFGCRGWRCGGFGCWGLRGCGRVGCCCCDRSSGCGGFDDSYPGCCHLGPCPCSGCLYWRQSSRDSHWVVDDLHLGHLVQAVAEDSGELLVLVGTVRVEDREAVEVVERPEKASELWSCHEGGGACQAEEQVNNNFLGGRILDKFWRSSISE